MLYYFIDFFIKLFQIVFSILFFYLSIILFSLIAAKLDLDRIIGEDNAIMIIGILSLVLTYFIIKYIAIFFRKLKEQEH